LPLALLGLALSYTSDAAACGCFTPPDPSVPIVQAGELITAFGGHPSLKIGPMLETHQHDVNEILKEAHDHEKVGLDEYHKLLGLVTGHNVLLEEYARDQISAEEMHLADIRKMMRKPGSIK